MNASATQPVKNTAAIRQAKLTRTARQVVGSVFFGTLLKQMRNSPFKSKLFSGGRGEEAFGAIRDQHMAEQLGMRAGKSLADSMVKRLGKGLGATVKAVDGAIGAGMKAVGTARSAPQSATIDTVG
jgi:Rod binding domain-containing protein